MIPKKIHYIWLSGEKMPKLYQKCIDSWKNVMPDYEIKCWDKKNSPTNQWVCEAMAMKKWAFASDYIRHYVLHKEGGIYLDADIFAKKSFDNFLNDDYFTAIEYNKKKYEEKESGKLLDNNGHLLNQTDIVQGLTIQAAIIGSIAGHPLSEEIMQYYENNHFIDNNDKINYIIATDVMVKKMEKYGFRYCDTYQSLKHSIGRDIIIYPTEIFASGLLTALKNSYAIHMYASSWRDYSVIENIIRKIKMAIKIFLLRV